MKSQPDFRFWKRITILENGCWQWTASVNADGYARFFNGQRMVLGHRWTYETYVGAVPEPLILIVANGKEGSGMSCQLVPEVAVQTPGVLRLAADILEKDLKKFQSGALN